MEGVSPRRGSRKALRKSWHWRASGFPCGTPTVLAVSWERLPKESALFLKSGCKISLKSGTFSILKKNFRIIRIFRSSHTGLCLWYSLRVKMTVFLGFIHWGGGETDQNELGGAFPRPRFWDSSSQALQILSGVEGSGSRSQTLGTLPHLVLTLLSVVQFSRGHAAGPLCLLLPTLSLIHI